MTWADFYLICFAVGFLFSLLSLSIRENGTGEIIYSQAGTRRNCGARCEDGNAIAKGAEVMVARYEKGIAYVRLWAEVSGEQEQQGSASDKTPGG